MTERILDLTLEVNYLLTGEDYIVVKRSGESIIQGRIPCASDGSSRTQSASTVPLPHSLIQDRNNDQKVLKLTNQIIHLLTGEVWKYLEGHKEPYNDLMMDTHQSLCSLVEVGTQAVRPRRELIAELTDMDQSFTTAGDEKTMIVRERLAFSGLNPSIELVQQTLGQVEAEMQVARAERQADQEHELNLLRAQQAPVATSLLQN
ncbi:Hypothetical predicted protein [Pelobates cultripes]|uniref:Uncharacterized protein n=1 Tax=Pelobates cultripes TaxID=61616 RepID=A0AAD1WMU7_PELCU|nr:Hypothetical predicted protein [Pelobates cultripes]